MGTVATFKLVHEPERIEFYLRTARRANAAEKDWRLAELYDARHEVLNDSRALLQTNKEVPVTVLSAYVEADDDRPYFQICMKQRKAPVRHTRRKAGDIRAPTTKKHKNAWNLPVVRSDEDSGTRNIYYYINGAPNALWHLLLPVRSPQNPICESGISNAQEGSQEGSFEAFRLRRRSSTSSRILEGVPAKHFHEDAYSSIRLEVYRSNLVEPHEDRNYGYIEEESFEKYTVDEKDLAGRGHRHSHFIAVEEPQPYRLKSIAPWNDQENPLEADDDEFPYLHCIFYFKSKEKLSELGILEAKEHRRQSFVQSSETENDHEILHQRRSSRSRSPIVKREPAIEESDNEEDHLPHGFGQRRSNDSQRQAKRSVRRAATGKNTSSAHRTKRPRLARSHEESHPPVQIKREPLRGFGYLRDLLKHILPNTLKSSEALQLFEELLEGIGVDIPFLEAFADSDAQEAAAFNARLEEAVADFQPTSQEQLNMLIEQYRCLKQFLVSR